MLKIITPPTQPILIEDLGMQYATEKSKNKSRFGIYKCSCGNEFKAVQSNIKRHSIQSCGCYKKEVLISRITKHGLNSHPLYSVWERIIQRIKNPKASHFKDYGGRGISICERWNDFQNFYDDMIDSYHKDLTIDRINPNGDYNKNNCRWATKKTQSRNTRLIYAHNTSGYRGVSFDNSRKKWKSSIKINSKSKYIGRFLTALDAAIAFDTYVIENNLEHTTNGVVINPMQIENKSHTEAHIGTYDMSMIGNLTAEKGMR